MFFFPPAIRGGRGGGAKLGYETKAKQRRNKHKKQTKVSGRGATGSGTKPQNTQDETRQNKPKQLNIIEKQTQQCKTTENKTITKQHKTIKNNTKQNNHKTAHSIVKQNQTSPTNTTIQKTTQDNTIRIKKKQSNTSGTLFTSVHHILHLDKTKALKVYHNSTYNNYCT